MPAILHSDVFSPALLESESLVVSLEQQNRIRDILRYSSSDSKFADKAFDAIWFVLTNGSAVPPVVTSLNPSTVVIGSPDFDVHVVGTGFTPDSKIIFAGVEEPTTHVSDTELTTGVNMTLWVGADSVPVSVANSNGIVSDPMMFTFTAAAGRVLKEENKTIPPHHDMNAPKFTPPPSPMVPSHSDTITNLAEEIKTEERKEKK